MWNKQQNKIFVYIVLIFGAFCYFIDSFTEEKTILIEVRRNNVTATNYSKLLEDSTVQFSSPKKTILFWNSYWHWNHFKMGVGNRGFSKCPMKNCYTTTRKNNLKNPKVVIDAIMFHGVGLKIEDVKKLKSFRSYISNVNNGIDPLFILFMLEAPTGASLTDPIFNDFFNLTLTYRSSADISRPYGRFVDKFTHQAIDFSKVIVPENIKISKSSTKNPNITKAKDIAWIVSHCETNSHREKYVEKLKKLLNTSTLSLDIYGECGPLDLPKPKKESNYQESYSKISSEYKFYLSFENSLCEEYITEKFFNAMNNGMIPIAFGGLNQTDYSKIAPPHSYIHVDDYESPEKLIEILEIIKQNETLHQSYFWWMDYYSLKTKILAEENQCSICQIINQQPGFKSKNDYSDFTTYWNKCRS